MATLLTKLWNDKRGQDFTEYALIGGLVACVSVGIVPEMIAITAHIEELLLSALQACIQLATLK
jgi:Flp pilus assembly pilin Flp